MSGAPRNGRAGGGSAILSVGWFRFRQQWLSPPPLTLPLTMKFPVRKQVVIIYSAGLLLPIAVMLLLGLLAPFEDGPIKIRFTRFQKDDAGLNVAMFEFSNCCSHDLNIRVPGVDLDGRGGVGTLEFNIDAGTRTHVLVPVPTNNSPRKIRASYLTTPALLHRWKVIHLLNREFHFRLTHSDFVFAPTVVGLTVEPLPNL
jgi:hypothetical protein